VIGKAAVVIHRGLCAFIELLMAPLPWPSQRLAHRTDAASLERFSPRPQGELAGSCLPLRTGEKRPCATVLPLSASAWVIRTPVKHRLGRRASRTLVAKPRRCRWTSLRAVLVPSLSRCSEVGPTRPAHPTRARRRVPSN